MPGQPGEGTAKCLFTAKTGHRCGNCEIEGLEYCLLHVPDEYLEEAEEVTGRRRCRHDFGEPDACRQYAVYNTVPPQCKNHGANAGSVARNQAAGRTVEGKITDRLAEIMAENGQRLLHPSPIGDPLNELLDLAAEMGEFKEIMREVTTKLIEMSKVRYTTVKTGEQLRMEVLLYERALERFAHILIQISKLKIEERLAGVHQQTANMLERALDAALEESGVGLDGINGARQAFRRHLKVVQGELAG
jgi:hypothetical protein